MSSVEKWVQVENFVKNLTGKVPQDLKGFLFLIGVQVLGKGPKNFSKEEKQDLIHIAICEIFSLKGHYTLSHVDPDGWPHYTLNDKLPHEKLFGQEAVIKEQIISYFETHAFI